MIIKKLLFGALAGAAATVPMTILMIEWHKRLPPDEQYPLPPREIFDELTEKAGIENVLREDDKKSLSIAGHFAYGAATGAVYAPLIALVQPPNAINGAVYGLGLWAASYLGWLPALRILRSAAEHPAERNALMIAAHLTWGAALGAIIGQITKNEN